MRFHKATAEDCDLIYQLALPTWNTTYANILSAEQIEYMVNRMYSRQALQNQMENKHVFFIAYSDNDEALGFISLNPEQQDVIILEKLYVLPSAQGSGVGKFLVTEAEKYIRQLCPAKKVLIELNVNKNNKAVGFYESMGFYTDRSVNEDIGNGFYKNDYIMRKQIGPDD